MPPSPTGPYLATVGTSVSGSGIAWVNPNNVGSAVSYATNTTTAGNTNVNPLNATGFNFNIPHTAIIDGIVVGYNAFMASGVTANDGGVQLLRAGTAVGSNRGFVNSWTTTATNYTYGGSSDLWGTTWTYSDINNANFGVQLSPLITNGNFGQINIDDVVITVYWHTAPTNTPRQKYYIYKVFDNAGNYLGNLPNVLSPYQCAQDINSGGSQITVECAISADTASQSNSALLDETGTAILDETGATLFDLGAPPVVSTGTGQAIIRDGNTVQVMEYGYYHPNGISKFRGVIERTESTYGGDTGMDTIKVLLYSEGSDMDQHLVRGSPYTYTNDVSQTSQNSNTSIYLSTLDKSSNYNYVGQTFTTGSGVTNLGAITLYLNGTANVTIDVYDSPSLTNHLGTVTQAVSVGAATAVQFTFATHIKVTAGTQYFFTVTVGSNQSITIYYSNANPYVSGQMYTNTFAAGSGGGWAPSIGNDLYFVTASTNGSLTATFSGVDPSTGLLETVMNDYNQEGGKVTYTSSTITATGLSITYTCNTNTTYEALQAALSVSPSGFYFYVDLGTSVLNFLRANTAADIVLNKGYHLNKITIITSIESMVNTAYVSGGTVSGSNIFTVDQDAASVALYGQRITRHNDNRITDTTTAHAVGGSLIADLKTEQYMSTVTVVDKTMDLNTLKPGLIIGFEGFGTFVDGLLAQIVHIDDNPDYATIQLGLLPKRQAVAVDQITRGLVALATVANPTTPS